MRKLSPHRLETIEEILYPHDQKDEKDISQDDSYIRQIYQEASIRVQGF